MPDDPQPPRTGAFRRPPSLPKALAKVAASNLIAPISDSLADEWASGAMQEYADTGGDASQHADAFGMAAAGGAVLPEALLAMLGVGGAKAVGGAVKAGRNARFLRTVGSEAPDFARAASPIEYVRPTLGEPFRPSLRAQAAMAKGAHPAPPTPHRVAGGGGGSFPGSLAASVLALLSSPSERE